MFSFLVSQLGFVQLHQYKELQIFLVLGVFFRMNEQTLSLKQFRKLIFLN